MHGMALGRMEDASLEPVKSRLDIGMHQFSEFVQRVISSLT